MAYLFPMAHLQPILWSMYIPSVFVSCCILLLRLTFLFELGTTVLSAVTVYISTMPICFLYGVYTASFDVFENGIFVARR